MNKGKLEQWAGSLAEASGTLTIEADNSSQNRVQKIKDELGLRTTAGCLGRLDDLRQLFVGQLVLFVEREALPSDDSVCRNHKVAKRGRRISCSDP